MLTHICYRISFFTNPLVRNFGRNANRIDKVKPLKIAVENNTDNDEKIARKMNRKEFRGSEEFQDDPEGFGDNEADLMQAHLTHREYEIEMLKQHERLKFQIVKRKYFARKMPNFITYAEKQQIKMLNSKDPEENSPEILSQSFPATTETIAKIIKSKWVTTSEKRIQNHDASVIENWKLFREGKLTGLDVRLADHLQKFATRCEDDLKNFSSSIHVAPQLPKPRSQQFSSIITSVKKDNIEESSRLAKDNVQYISQNADLDETFYVERIHSKMPIQFKDLKKNTLFGDQKKESNTSDVIEKRVVHSEPEQPSDLESFDRLPTEVVEISQEDIRKYEITTIKQRIHIPRKLWKKGILCKVADCYYDDDGEFLYRVPGMTGNSY